MMPSPAMFLQTVGQPAAEPSEPLAVDFDVVVILGELLCALICFIGLALVSCYAWLRRSTTSAGPPPPPPTDGLKKKTLGSLSKVTFDSSTAGGELTDCPICLAEFVDGDDIRILPQCGHVFHVGCVDTWLRSHSSCPSCRQILVVAAASRCQKCSAAPAPTWWRRAATTGS